MQLYTYALYVVFNIEILDLIWQQMDEKYRNVYVINTYLFALINFTIPKFIYCFGVTFY